MAGSIESETFDTFASHRRGQAPDGAGCTHAATEVVEFTDALGQVVADRCLQCGRLVRHYAADESPSSARRAS